MKGSLVRDDCGNSRGISKFVHAADIKFIHVGRVFQIDEAGDNVWSSLVNAFVVIKAA